MRSQGFGISRLDRWISGAIVATVALFPIVMAIFTPAEEWANIREKQFFDNVKLRLYMAAVAAVEKQVSPETEFPSSLETTVWSSGPMWVVSFEPRVPDATGKKVRKRATVVFDLPDPSKMHEVRQVMVQE